MSPDEASRLPPPVDDRLRTIERATLAGLVAVNVVFPAIVGLAAWPRPWRAFDGETSPLNWFSSVQCLLIAAVACAAWVVTLLGGRIGTEPVRRAWPWLLFAAGFALMSLDEQFSGHEAIREGLLKPNEIFTGFDLLMPGDVVLIFYVVAGAAAAFFLLPELKRNRPSLILFVAAVCLIGVTAVQDALDLESVATRTFRHWQTILEELGEIWAQLMFAVAFLLILFGKSRRLLEGIATAGSHRAPR